MNFWTAMTIIIPTIWGMMIIDNIVVTLLNRKKIVITCPGCQNCQSQNKTKGENTNE